MRSLAAVLYSPNEPIVVEEIEVDEPRADEVTVRMVASGFCHSDYHFITGDMPVGPNYYPVVLGHEAAGTIERVGSAVTELTVGQHVIVSYIPACGRCRWCRTGHSNLCDKGGGALSGRQPDGTTRMHTLDGRDISQFCTTSTFSELSTMPAACCIPVEDDLPLDKICLLSCGVPTGFNSAVTLAKVEPGDTVVVFGVGGVGMNAVQGAWIAGASRVIAVDPFENKLDIARQFGATHTVNPDKVDPVKFVTDLTWGLGADRAILTAGVVTSELIAQGVASIRKMGRVVITGLAGMDTDHIDISPLRLTLMQKEITGSMFGGAEPMTDTARLLSLYRAKRLKLDELITTTYKLQDVNLAVADLVNGKNIRGVIEF